VDKETARQIVAELAAKFKADIKRYTAPTYNETELRIQFLNPMFEALGWDVADRTGRHDVTHEDYVEREQMRRTYPNYGFRVDHQLRFFVEAKKPAVNLQRDPNPAFQVRRYGWSAGLPISIVTDFEAWIVYDCRLQPDRADKPARGRLDVYTYEDYVTRWDEFYDRFSYDAVRAHSLERWISTVKQRGTVLMDVAFLNEMETWRRRLAEDIALHNPAVIDSPRALNMAVQTLIDRIIFLRICEDREIEPPARLKDAVRQTPVYDELKRLFRQADSKYNSGLFHFASEPGRDTPDTLTLSLTVPDTVLSDLIGRLYDPSPYAFAVIPADILGQIYERFLGSVIEVAAKGKVSVVQKPEVRKAGGVYYTPTYIVDYIVQHTVGALVADKTPDQVAALCILDPACGSGSFLIGAFQFLVDWHAAYYAAHQPEKHLKDKRIRPIHTGATAGDLTPRYALTTDEKKRILLNNLYGVDLDQQAVEVTKLSLLLKVLEGESAVTTQLELMADRVLPDLGHNIRWGNSLIAPDYYEGKQLALLNDESIYRVKAFDWGDKREGFGGIMAAGGFDAVIGNPPYIDSEWMTKHHADERAYCTGRYRAASGNWDIFCVFIEKALQLCKLNGFNGMIVPNKLGSEDYAEGARFMLAVQNTPIVIRDYSHVPVFPVSVYPIVYIVQKTPPVANTSVLYEQMQYNRDAGMSISRTHRFSHGDYFSDSKSTWRIFAQSEAGDLIKQLLTMYPKLASIATVLGAATVNEAYQLTNLIEECTTNKKGLKIVNSGTIDRYKSLWGQEKMRYLKKSYQYPIICSDNQTRLPPKRHQQARSPKIIIAGMTKTLEGMLDAEGNFLAAKSTTIVLGNLNLKYLLGIINSKLINFWYNNVYGGKKLSGGYLRVGPGQIGQIPIRAIDPTNPADQAAHDQIVRLVTTLLDLHANHAAAPTDAVRAALHASIAAADRQLDQLVYHLYGLTDAEIALIEGAD
jgi:predicted type IV restriction endonuclease